MVMREARLLKDGCSIRNMYCWLSWKDGDNLAATVLEEHRVDYQAVFGRLSIKSTNPEKCGNGIHRDDEEG